MISRLALRSWPRTARPGLRTLTTDTHLTDHLTGETIKMSNPSRPQIADYPNIEPKLALSRDPYAKYDFQQMRRNKGEPLSIDDDLYDMWSPDYYQFVSDKTALKHNALFFSVIFGLAGLVVYFELNPEKPAMPRSFPYNGLAKSLGSGDDESDFFYRVKPDTTAEAAGVLVEEEQVAAQKQAYLAANQDFFKA